MTTFSTIVSFHTIEEWIINLADRWFLEYLAEVERQINEPPRTFPPLATYVRANDFDKWPEEILPALMVMDTGQAEAAMRKGDGKWDARRMYVCSIIVSTPRRSDTRRAMQVYSAAFKAMMLQHRGLEHPERIKGVTWVDERPAPIPSESEQSIGAMNMFFLVDVMDIVDERGTPPFAEPRPDPYAPPGDPVTITKAGPIVINLVEEIT